MTTIYGVNSQTYQRLAPEDQASIRASYLARQEEAAPAPAPAPAAEALPAPSVDAATTARDAVTALHALPVPDNADLGSLQGLPPEDRQSIVDGRAAVYNATRAEAAQAAIERLAPQRSDYASLPPATADMEFQAAQQAWRSDPYAQELQRIVDEARASPATIPGYLDAAAASTADTSQFTPQQVSDALALVGVEIPADAPADVLAAGRELLGTMPDSMLAMLINPGSQVSFQGGGVLGTPNIAGPSIGYELEVGAQVSLTDVQTGVDFAQTQQFEASVQTQQGTTFDVSRSLPQQIYKWSGRVANLPDSVRGVLDRVPGFDRLDDTLRNARGAIDDIPALRQVLKGLPVSGSYSTFEGERLSYEAVVTPEQGALLAAGDTDGMPNPLDPLSMPEGTSVLMRGQTLEGSAFELNWKALTVGGTHTELSGQGFGVTRGEGSIVEVYSGPVDTVENTAFLGIGRQGTLAVGIGSDLSMEERTMQIAQIDLATAEGQAAYQTFISTGQVPAWSPPGVPQSGTTEVFSHEYASFIGLQVGGLSIGGASDANGNITRTTWADGSVEFSNTYTSTGGVTSDVRYQVGADGEPVYDDATWTVVRADLDPVLANNLESAYDPSRVNQFADGNQHVQMQLTTDQLMQIRDRARDYVVDLQGQEKLDNLDSGLESPWWSNQEEALAIAQTPEEVFAVLSDDFHGGSVIQSLLAMTLEGGALDAQTLPGEFRSIPAG